MSCNSEVQQPIGRLKPGDRVRFVGGDCVFTVVDSDGTLVRLLSEHGTELRAGWRVLERVREVTS